VRETLLADGLACSIVAVDTRQAFETALAGGGFDVILADYQLPSFDGLTAQTIAAERAPDVPFIFVSGTLGEDIAVERLKAGATDYVLKQRLSRLGGAVRRALAEADVRIKKQRAEADLRQLNAELDARVALRTQELADVVSALASHERQLRESEARLQAVMDNSPAAIFVKDLGGRYVMINREFLSITGRSAEQIIGLTDLDVFTPRLAEIYRKNDQHVLDTSAPAFFEEPAVKDGQVRIYASSKFPLRNAMDEVYAICGIALDVTEKRHAEEAIKISAREAERANEAKSDFLSRMSHDLRTPLNAILGFAQVLESEALPRDQADSVRQILAGGRHLLELINEVLDITRIETGHLSLSPEPVAIADVVRHVTELMKPLAAQQGITLRLEADDAPRYVQADRQRLIQILLNLLSNAVKYNRPNGVIVLSTGNISDNRFRITVTDTGFGIPREKVGLLFRRFERLGAEGTEVEGTGLGLAVSKGLAEAMGGSMGVQTTVNVGSSFWVELALCDPIQTAPDVAVEERRGVAENDVRGTVLYIEDNGANVRLLERVLQRRPGVKLITAANGTLGITLAGVHVPNLILLDLHLPDMNGEDVLHRLLQGHATRRIPVVVLSADATSAQERRLRAAGASDYLTKPFNVARVLQTIDSHVASAHEHT